MYLNTKKAGRRFAFRLRGHQGLLGHGSLSASHEVHGSSNDQQSADTVQDRIAHTTSAREQDTSLVDNSNLFTGDGSACGGHGAISSDGHGHGGGQLVVAFRSLGFDQG